MGGEPVLDIAKLAVMELGTQEQRVPQERDDLHMRRRTNPAVYIVDENLKVLFSRADPSERRSECRPNGGALPPAIEATVSALCAARAMMAPLPDTLASVPTASLAVRVVWLDGPTNAMAVLVERMQMRNHLSTAQTRYGLSRRELEVLRCLVAGGTNAEISGKLHIAESTVVYHIKRLLQKMQARNRTELVSKLVA